MSAEQVLTNARHFSDEHLEAIAADVLSSLLDPTESATPQPRGPIATELFELIKRLSHETDTLEVCRDACSDDDVGLKGLLGRSYQNHMLLDSDLHAVLNKIAELEAQKNDKQ